jgi:cell wall-associated NlpC family hydrolase
LHPASAAPRRWLRRRVLWLAPVLVAIATALGVLVVGDVAGAHSGDVRLIQRDLNGLAYRAGSVDGRYGAQTTAAVRSFQHDNGLAVDGDAGPATTAALVSKVRQVQRAAGATADGNYGPATTSAVRAYQRTHELGVDGIAGPATMKAMGITRVSGGGGGGGGGGACAAGSRSGSNTQKVERVVAAALSQTGRGLSYSWAGGGKCGPSYGVCCSPAGYNDTHRFGYDCSGLTQYAFWHGAGVDIGGYTGSQITSGRRVSRTQIRRGDLIFYGSSASNTTHVALYLGGGRMVESASPRTSTSVHETAVRYGNALSFVVRVFP